MGSGEILVILLIALVVLGPEKLPKLAADIGRWVGRARAMARQLRTQLDQEVHLEDFKREQQKASSAPPAPAAPASTMPPETLAPEAPAAVTPAADASAVEPAQPVGAAASAAPAIVPPSPPAPAAADGQH